MTIHIDLEGNIIWNFYRKAYRKARWRRIGTRCIQYMQKHYPGSDTLIVF